jgi:ABC transporter DrrB family efflux protein
MRARNAWFIARKDVQYLLMKRETLLWTFVMPVIFFYFIGTITGGFGNVGGTVDKLALEVSGQTGFLGEQLVRRLEEQSFEIVPADSEEAATLSRRLTVPAGLTESVLAKEPSKVVFTNTSDGIMGDYDQIRIQRAVYTLVADLIATSESGQPLSPAAIAKLNEAPRSLTMRVAPAGERQDAPTGFEQAVPGTMVMFTLVVLLTSGAVLLVTERNQGLLRRLASTPITRGEVVVGKSAGRLALGLIQIAFALLAGWLFFGIDWGRSLPMVLVVLFAYAALAAGLGVLLGSLARTEGQAVGLGVLSANLLAALGGCWWPIEVTPAWMQSFSKLLPTGLAMDALHQLVNFGAPWTTVLPHAAVLFAAAVVVAWMATRVFRYA